MSAASEASDGRALAGPGSSATVLADRIAAPKLSAPAVLGPSRALAAADAFHEAMFG